MKLTFIGDIMLGRFVSDKYKEKQYDIISKGVQDRIKESDFVVANLESPITTQVSNNSLAFAGDSCLLSQLKFINLLSLSNNHINDFGEEGISETIKLLDKAGIEWNGVYENEYKPYVIEDVGVKIAIITCTDMLNDELDDTCKYSLLRADSPQLNQIIHDITDLGYFPILFAHCGSLFSRFPNPPIRDILYSAIEAGAKCVVTCHSHCLGGMDSYKNVPIFYSLGDFLMDGSSYRRRRACVLKLEIEGCQLIGWDIIPTITNNDLQTTLPNKRLRDRILCGFTKVSKKMQKPRKNYTHFYKWQYKVEILNHSLSTLHFLYESKGFSGFCKMIIVRFMDVKRMIHRMVFDRSNVRYDADAVSKSLKNSDIK